MADPSPATTAPPASGPPAIVFGRPCIGEEEVQAVAEVLRSGWIGTGPRTAEFERAFAATKEAPAALALHSCTAALELTLHELGIGPGDEVIVCPITFAADANVIEHRGARVVFADCDPATGNIDPARASEMVTGRTRALLVVHLAGRPAPMGPLLELCSRHGIALIEDCAHAIEGRWQGRPLGTLGETGCFSFYATKNLTTAEGGMLIARDPARIARCRTRSLHGLSAGAWERSREQGYAHALVIDPGYKYNMTDIQAAIGLVQLRRLEHHGRRRAAVWAFYDEELRDLALDLPPPAPEGDVHARHLYSPRLRLEQTRVTRDELLIRLKERGVGSGVHFISLHLHPYYRDRYQLEPESLPGALEFSQRTFSLPLSGCLGLDEAGRVVDAVRASLVKDAG
jgi:dTDP-4-amino-4,6-dideoxygalactose transaminase